MDEKERLINEVKGLLAGEKSSISKTKSIILDKKTKQLSIKIPKEIGSAGLLNEHTEVKIVFNPSKKI